MKIENVYLEKKKKIQQDLLETMDFSKEITDQELFELIDEKIYIASKDQFLPVEERKRIRNDIFSALRKLDILEELLADKQITEIMINGKEQIFIEKEGQVFPWQSRFESEEKLDDIIQRIVAKSNRVVNESVPIVDARLENGSRVNVVLKPIALNGPIVTIRKFPEKQIQMHDLIKYGTITLEITDFLKELMIAGYNIFISGGTGSGKTTFLNALSYYIPTNERIITIEDSAELQIRNIPNIVKLEARNATAEGCEEISIRDLIKAALRMRPDRIIVGEIRGKEAIDLLQAMNTGHDGSLSTGHSNSALDMLYRIETMVLMGMDIPIAAIRQQVASAIDIMIHLGKLQDNSRKVIEIIEIVGITDGQIQINPIYRYDYKQKKMIKKGELKNVEKLQAANIAVL